MRFMVLGFFCARRELGNHRDEFGLILYGLQLRLG